MLHAAWNENYREVTQKLFASRHPASLFLTKDEKPSEYLKELLNIDHLYDAKDYLEDIVKKTQKFWLQTVQGAGGKERIDLVDADFMIARKNKVLDLTKNLGLFDQQMPIIDNYDYAICLGTLLEDVRMHLYNLVEAWKKGVYFKSIVFLTGERYLRNKEGQNENIAHLLNPSLSPLPFKKGWTLPSNAPYETEYDMIKLVWDQVQLPEEMECQLRQNATFVNAKQKNNLRPSTRDTFYSWLNAYHPAPGTVLGASYPLLWTYQQLVGFNVLGTTYPLDMIGPALREEDIKRHEEYFLSIVYDTLAKCLYELYCSKHQTLSNVGH